jgi:hypothetical protein
VVATKVQEQLQQVHAFTKSIEYTITPIIFHRIFFGIYVAIGTISIYEGDNSHMETTIDAHQQVHQHIHL